MKGLHSRKFLQLGSINFCSTLTPSTLFFCYFRLIFLNFAARVSGRVAVAVIVVVVIIVDNVAVAAAVNVAAATDVVVVAAAVVAVAVVVNVAAVAVHTEANK